MNSLMQDMPLLVSGILEHARRWHGNQEIVSMRGDGEIHRQSFRKTAERTSQLAHALIGLGVSQGDRIGILALNSHRHLELWYAISGIGAIAHSINPRLTSEQIEFVVEDANDTILFVDPFFMPIAGKALESCSCIKELVVLEDATTESVGETVSVLNYEDLIEGHPTTYLWPEIDEHTPNALCHTSGTTGNPKGVLYNHRSNVLHALGVSLKDAVNIGATDVILPMAPMFHANGWGIPYAALMHGAKLVFCGPRLDGESLLKLVDQEKVTLALGVPTICLTLLEQTRKSGSKLEFLSSLVIAGSAAPISMIEAYADFGVEIIHCWGMTETSPIGTASAHTATTAKLKAEENLGLKTKQGRPLYGVELKIVDDDGNPVDHDGSSLGNLQVRGLWIMESYLNAPKSATDEQGWLDTGDIATIDSDGFMQIMDRAKDVVKSGGEWISSVDLENISMSHDRVSQAAAIGLPHPKWGERPLLVVVSTEGQLTKGEIIEFLSGKVAKFWLPDEVIFVSELPIGATGKVLKNKLREKYHDYYQGL